MSLITFYIGVIQMSLLYLTFLVGFCELTPLFANNLKSTLARFTLCVALLCLGYYAHYLYHSPYPAVLSLLVVTLAVSFCLSKYLIIEYSKRKRRQEKLEKVKETRGKVQA